MSAEIAQRVFTHSSSTVVENILRIDHDNDSDESVSPLHKTDIVPAKSTSTSNRPVFREPEAWTIDRVMMTDDVFDGFDQLYGASCTQCGLD